MVSKTGADFAVKQEHYSNRHGALHALRAAANIATRATLRRRGHFKTPSRLNLYAKTSKQPQLNQIKSYSYATCIKIFARSQFIILCLAVVNISKISLWYFGGK